MTHTFNTAPTQAVLVEGVPFVYRKLGKEHGTPLVLLHHLTAVLEDWDPRVIDGLAQGRPVIVFDNRGVGGSGGITPASVEAMAEDTAAFIRALGLQRVDLLGFSLGGFVAQVILRRHPELVHRAILAGTGPAGSAQLSNDRSILGEAYARAAQAGKHPKHFLFFTQTAHGQREADAFLARLNERQVERDAPVSDVTVAAQLTAIRAWLSGPATDLEAVTHPVFVANGDNDVMVPTSGSFELARRIPNTQLAIYPDAGHAGIFQNHELFVRQALAFLDISTCA